MFNKNKNPDTSQRFHRHNQANLPPTETAFENLTGVSKLTLNGLAKAMHSKVYKHEVGDITLQDVTEQDSLNDIPSATLAVTDEDGAETIIHAFFDKAVISHASFADPNGARVLKTMAELEQVPEQHWKAIKQTAEELGLGRPI